MIRHGKTILFVIGLVMICSCSNGREGYSNTDRLKANLNKLPYWEDIIFLFPTHVDRLTKDRMIIPRATLKAMPPTKTFYDEEGSPIQWEERDAPDEFAGYRVEITYRLSGNSEMKEKMLNMELVHSEPVTRAILAGFKEEEDVQIHVINGFRVYRSDPDVRLSMVAFFNPEFCIIAQILPADPELHSTRFETFLEKINKGRLLTMLEELGRNSKPLSSGEEDGVNGLDGE